MRKISYQKGHYLEKVIDIITIVDCNPSFVTLKFNIFRSLNFKKIGDYYIVLEDNNTQLLYQSVIRVPMR